MVSHKKTDVTPAKRVEQHKKVAVALTRRVATELLRRVDAMARVMPAKKVTAALPKRVDAACSAVLTKRVLLRKVAVTVRTLPAKRVAVVPLKREPRRRVAIAARRVDIAALRCSLA